MDQQRFDFLTRMKQSSKLRRLRRRGAETETKLAEDSYVVLSCVVAQASNEIPDVLLVCSMYESFTLRAAFIGDSVLHTFN